ncbi:MAG TPA: FHA domain-containing protein [Vicinamibacterales bacterium]|jgi:predicted component of type VI protein secretion system
MAKIVLRFGDQVLKEYELGAHALKIGRLPDNTVVIDNPAVSSHHARIVYENGKFVLEDLKSTNGSYVNEQRVNRHTLENGDMVLIGKHKLVYDASGGEGVAEAPETPPEDESASKLEGGTVFLDTKQQRALLAKMGIDVGTVTQGPDTIQTHGPTASGAPKHAPRIAVLRVLAGKSDQNEYILSQATSVIGSADTAAVKLKGWFKPKSAVAIARRGDTYTATALGGKQTINNEPLSGRRDLKEGDILMVSGLTLEFRYKE